MDTAGIKSAIADNLAAARFRLFIKPVEHTSKVEPAVPVPPNRRRRSKQRFNTGSWVVTMSGGFIRVPSRDGRLNEIINNAIAVELDRLFQPGLVLAAARYEANSTIENLLRLDHVFKNYEDAKNIRADYDGNGLLVPGGNGVARFDTEDWEDGDAEVQALAFMSRINSVIEHHTQGVINELRKNLIQKVKGG